MSLTLVTDDALPTALLTPEHDYSQRATESRPAEITTPERGVLRQAPWDMLAVLTVTGAVMVLSLMEAAVGMGPLRLLLAVPVLLLLPGYALTVLLFAKAGQVNWIERLGLSLAFSVAAVVFTCLGLFFLGTPLGGQSILLGIVCVNGLLAVGSIVRRYSLPQAERFEPWAGWRLSALGNGPDRITAVGIALVIALGLGAVWYSMTNGTSREWLTEFAVATDGSTNGGAVALNTSGSYNLTLSVTNREESEQSYSVRVLADSRKVWSSDSVTLGPGENWRGQVSVPARAVMKSGLIRLELWLPGVSTPYRELHMRATTSQTDPLWGAR